MKKHITDEVIEPISTILDGRIHHHTNTYIYIYVCVCVCPAMGKIVG